MLDKGQVTENFPKKERLHFVFSRGQGQSMHIPYLRMIFLFQQFSTGI
jgi:hypothetical protein